MSSVKIKSTEMIFDLVVKYGDEDNRKLMKDLKQFREQIRYEDFRLIRKKLSTFENFKRL